jgi:hypothetical protein
MGGFLSMVGFYLVEELGVMVGVVLGIVLLCCA